MTSPTISPALRSLCFFSNPDAQNVHPMLQPTCEVTHRLSPKWKCISTASTLLPSISCSRNLMVPSFDTCLVSSLTGMMAYSALSFSINAAGRSVISEKDIALLRYNHVNSCFARYGFWPYPASISSSCFRFRSYIVFIRAYSIISLSFFTIQAA